MTPTVSPRSVGQDGVRVISTWEDGVMRRILRLECDNETLRSEVERLKRQVAALERLVTSAGGTR